MAKHDAKFKAGAVATLIGAGYPDNPYKLKEVADYLKVSRRSLQRWYKGEVGAPATEIVQQEKKELADIFEGLAFKLLEHASDQDVIDEMSGKDAVIAAATATDKMRLLRGLPTEIVQLIPDVILAIEKMGQKPSDVFQRIIQRAGEHVRSGQTD